MQLENSMFMYGVYNTDTLERLINTVHHIHNTTSSHERLFTLRSLYVNLLGLQHYSGCIIFFYRLTAVLVAFL